MLLRLRLNRLENLYEFHAFIERLVCAFKFRQDIDQIAEPEDGLLSLLERNTDLMDEIGYGFGAIRLVIVCANRGRGLANLGTEILELFAAEILNQAMDICHKLDRPRLEFGAEMLSAELLFLCHVDIIAH